MNIDIVVCRSHSSFYSKGRYLAQFSDRTCCGTIEAAVFFCPDGNAEQGADDDEATVKQSTSLLGRPRQFDRDVALRTAMKLFCRHGYEGVSISDLTRTLGIAPTSLYAAFGNKDMLYREALALFSNRPTRPKLNEDGAVYAEILSLLQDVVRAETDPDYPGCMVTLGMLNSGAQHCALAETVAGLRASSCQQLIAFLDRAQARGELPSGTDTRAMGRYIAALMQGIAVQAHDGATPEELLALVDIAMQSWPHS